MKAAMILPVILCGGAGKRLWPLSQPERPKQFLRLTGRFSLFQNTILRLAGLGALPPLIICNQQHRFLVSEHLAEIDCAPSSIVLEPESRNTAAAIAAATLWAKTHAPGATLLVLPSDHAIHDTAAFTDAVKKAAGASEQQRIVTFGITPTYACSEYGYMQAGEDLSIRRFIEKPEAPLAEAMLAMGGWYWNSGMFCFTPDCGMRLFSEHAPDILHSVQEAFAEATPHAGGLLLGSSFAVAPAQPFDRAIMEKTDNATLIPLDAGWSDLGTWENLREFQGAGKG